MNMFRAFTFAAFLFSGTCLASEPIEMESDPSQRLDVRYRLFKTKNTWNFIELDTQTGRVWQVQFSVKEDDGRFKVPVNPDPLVKDGKSGRFTLYPSRNMYNYILLDQDTGKTWQIQFSTDGNQGIWLIEQSNDKKGASEWKQ